MPRIARVYSEGEGVYHLYNKVACHKDEYPFDRDGGEPKRQFLEILGFYAQAFECQIHAFTVMGNHFHLVAHFQDYQKLSRADLEAKIPLFYPNAPEQSRGWSDELWERFNRRIFDVSELMRSVQSSFARWYNKTYDRKGRFWADRYKSSLLLGEGALLECMQYIELNPVRAGIAPDGRPEDYGYSSLHYREIGQTQWLSPLVDLFNEESESEALRTYKAEVYYRGGVASKVGQAEISEDLIEREEANGFQSRRVFAKRMRFFTDGLVIGAKGMVEKWRDKFLASGTYKRSTEPKEQIVGHGICCLRGQRVNFRDI